MDEREAALQQIAALARAHGLTAADIAHAIGQSAPAARESQRRGNVLDPAQRSRVHQ